MACTQTHREEGLDLSFLPLIDITRHLADTQCYSTRRFTVLVSTLDGAQECVYCYLPGICLVLPQTVLGYAMLPI